ncbi:Oligopeptide transporter [Quillaja saponaria]|uniref:Oligopeptide transporter n=1 Tax=Quillaja saponaria TaxID=32244 RepID=A0AAD7KYF7_QUISA|nr:Oligopeptide transporter [Quillaja saponaria]
MMGQNKKGDTHGGQVDQDVEINDSPIEQVRLTVPITDDPTLPVLTFRAGVLGPICCVTLALLTQFFAYRQNRISISSSCVLLLIVILGKFVARTLPSSPSKIPLTNWTFSMNPAPFNIKEHVLITILATSGLRNPYALTLLPMMKVFYHTSINFWGTLFSVQKTQVLGFGFAGIFMKFLVNSPYVVPFQLNGCIILQCLIESIRALHEVEVRSKRRLTTLQFFLIATVSSFAFAVIPGYFFPSLAALSFVCWIWKDSVTAQIIGSGRHGLRIGSFAVDWNAISADLGNPLAYPISTIFNIMAGFIMFLYIINPVAYWTNLYSAKQFPFASYVIYDSNGQVYNIYRILNLKDLTLNQS